MRRISILNFKGGVGKTSLAINLSDELRRRGQVVLLVDCDRQRNASSIIPTDVEIGATLKEVLMGQSPIDAAIYEARPDLYVMPAHSDLELAGKHITVSGTRTLKTLKYGVERLGGVDFILFDHAPSYSAITDAALLASTEMLIPVELETFSISGIVPSNLDYTKSMTQMYLQSLKNRFGDRVTLPIRTDAQISKSQSMNQTVWEYNPHSKGTEDYAAIATLLLEQEVLV